MLDRQGVTPSFMIQEIDILLKEDGTFGDNIQSGPQFHERFSSMTVSYIKKGLA